MAHKWERKTNHSVTSFKRFNLSYGISTGKSANPILSIALRSNEIFLVDKIVEAFLLIHIMPQFACELARRNFTICVVMLELMFNLCLYQLT